MPAGHGHTLLVHSPEDPMRFRSIAVSALLACATPALAQLSINFFGSPGVSIGINLPVYPTLQRIPGYPVYYAPGVNTNYFFYDGLYWVFDGDNWYASSWYNGPWRMVDRFYVPDYVLRVPVRYYRHAPAYFRGWRRDAPPRWSEHWGSSWEQRRGGWDRWNRSSAPAPAPLPSYQRQYSGSRYPQQVTEQATLNQRNYRYQPRDNVAREAYQYQKTQVQAAPAPQPQPARQQVAPQPQRQQVAPQPQRQQVAPQPQQQQPQPRQQREQRERQAAPQPQPKQQQAVQPQQPNPMARREPAPPPPAAPQQQRGQGKGHERGRGEDQGKHQGRDKDKD